MKDLIDAAEHEVEIRKALEARRWEFSDASWDSWFSTVVTGDFFDVEMAVDALDKELTRVERHPARTRTPPTPMDEKGSSVSLDPPPGWATHTDEVLAKYSPDQELVRAVFGLGGPTSLAEQEDLIIGRFREQRVGAHDEVAELQFGRMIDPIRRGLERVKVFDGRSFGTGNYGSYMSAEGPVGMRFQPLYLLAQEAGRISWETGCEPFQAVDFLLSGVPIPLIWIDVQPRRRSGVITLRVGTPIVRVKDVARAYSHALAWLKNEQPRVIESAPKRRRRQRDRTAALLAFVAERAPDKRTIKTWEALYTQWNASCRAAWRYSSAKVMRERHRKAAILAARDQGARG